MKTPIDIYREHPNQENRAKALAYIRRRKRTRRGGTWYPDRKGYARMMRKNRSAGL